VLTRSDVVCGFTVTGRGVDEFPGKIECDTPDSSTMKIDSIVEAALPSFVTVN
jgi:hypothetical protein